jgi:hypothetical protein
MLFSPKKFRHYYFAKFLFLFLKMCYEAKIAPPIKQNLVDYRCYLLDLC